MKTLSIKKDQVQRKWHLIDAKGMILGRLASQTAVLLRGKHKPFFTPHVDTGDHVIVVNAEKIQLTGDKLRQKMYHRHSDYPKGLKSFKAEEVLQKKPESLITMAVSGMLPKNKLGRAMIKKLKVYAGSAHPHEAQSPEPFQLLKNAKRQERYG
jgi:large subunit ribosomal protein L13